MTNFPLFDTHAHLQDEKFSNELDSIIENAGPMGSGVFSMLEPVSKVQKKSYQSQTNIPNAMLW